MEVKVKNIFPFVIVYEKNLYAWTTKESQIGDIALCLEDTLWTKQGKYYLLVKCGRSHFKGIIGDDGDPMGIHDHLGRFRFYRKRK